MKGCMQGRITFVLNQGGRKTGTKMGGVEGDNRTRGQVGGALGVGVSATKMTGQKG